MSMTGPARHSAMLRPSMIKPEIKTTKLSHEALAGTEAEDHAKFVETGDAEMYTEENMRKREALKEDPQIRAWITMFFKTFSMQSKPWSAGNKSHRPRPPREPFRRASAATVARRVGP